MRDPLPTPSVREAWWEELHREAEGVTGDWLVVPHPGPSIPRPPVKGLGQRQGEGSGAGGGGLVRVWFWSHMVLSQRTLEKPAAAVLRAFVRACHPLFLAVAELSWAGGSFSGHSLWWQVDSGDVGGKTVERGLSRALPFALATVGCRPGLTFVSRAF